MGLFLNPQTFEARWGDFYYKKKFSVSSAGDPPTGGACFDKHTKNTARNLRTTANACAGSLGSDRHYRVGRFIFS
jgi:hypothetical protein